MKINPTTMVTTHHVELDDEELGFLAELMGYDAEKYITTSDERRKRGAVIRERLRIGLGAQQVSINKIRQSMGLANIGF